MNKKIEEIAQSIIQHCLSTKRRFIYISGNGGSGKTKLSKVLAQEALPHGRINILSMDDFVVDTTLRNSATTEWIDINNGRMTGRYTTSCAASYFLPSIKAIIFNLKEGNNYYHWPKKAQTEKECHLLYGDALISIIEGVGTVFLDRDHSDSISIFLKCQPEVEIARRIKRKESSSEQTEAEIRQSFTERHSQYKTYIEPHEAEHELVLESLEDHSFNIIRDSNGVLLDS